MVDWNIEEKWANTHLSIQISNSGTMNLSPEVYAERGVPGTWTAPSPVPISVLSCEIDHLRGITVCYFCVSAQLIKCLHHLKYMEYIHMLSIWFTHTYTHRHAHMKLQDCMWFGMTFISIYR